MRVSWKYLLVSVLLVFGVSTQAYAAAKSIADATAKPDKVAKRVWFGPAPSQIKKLHDIGMPERVGLISFYLYDTGTHEFSALKATYGGVFSQRIGLKEWAANLHASEFAKIGVPLIKEGFAEKGMVVLTPEEFLDSQEKLDAYTNFELHKNGLQKATESTLAWVSKTPNVTGAADGFRMIPLHASFLQQDVMRQLDEFQKALGLDALMVVTVHSGTNKSAVWLSSVTMQLVGPNPEPRPENEKHVKWWWPMIMYPSANFGKGFKGAVFHTFETKKAAPTTSYDGFEVIVDAMVDRTLAELQKHYDKGAR